MLWLTDYLTQLLYVLVVCAVGLWFGVLLEGARQARGCLRRSRTVRRLRRRCAHLELRVHALVRERDHWRDRAAHWQRAYQATTASAPVLKEDDAPVP